MSTYNLQYLPLSKIAEQIGIPHATLKIKLCLATQRGIPLPLRRRIGRQFFYDCIEFNVWLFENADNLKQSTKSLELIR
jgi:hypothetical protein